MKNIFLIVLIALFLAACTSTPDLRSDSDPNADFSQFKTYGFFDEYATDDKKYTTLVTQHFKDSLRREMNQRGYVYTTQNPDLLVNFNANLSEKLKVSSSPSYGIGVGGGRGYPGYYGYRGGHYGTYAGYSYNTTNVSQYTEGTVNVDLVDANKKQLAWEGVAVGRVNDKKSADLKASIGQVVVAIMAQYPYKAGSSTKLTPAQ
ncbi:MAG: DUF4136 domain-containing protein [Xanthomonadales bacterium]|nr:DUF4136 domain-containing protein [Xanthomonadales bacterium]